jgi:hypothetical protein
MSGTPFITIAPYIQASNYGKYYNIENGTVICNSIEEIFSTIVSIVENDDVYSELSKRMLNSRHKMFDNDYWNRFDQFIEKSAKN